MLDPKMFAPAPMATVGDRSRTPIYTAIGRVTTAWEGLEDFLSGLFSQLLGTWHPVGAGRAYGAIAGFSGRQDMLRAAAEAHFAYQPDTALEKEFGRLMELCKNASTRRNEVAHGVLIKPSALPGVFLGPPLYTSRKRAIGLAETYRLNSEQMNELVEKFTPLRIALHQFGNKILSRHQP
jgi:hypothetical protein